MKIKPKIAKLPFNDKSRVKTLVTQIINDVVLYPHTPDQIVILDDIITLVLWNKRYYFEEMQVDVPKDYTQVYLQGIKISTNDYEIGVNGENIVITFNDKIVPFQNDLVLEDFVIKGKIVNI
jgi:hypothetical protein